MIKRAKTNASAKVVDGNLIISLPNAKNPIVWRMALGEARAAALEVIARNDDHILILKTAKGETTDIAPFDTREAATDALMAVSHAMENASGHIKPSATTVGNGVVAAPKDGSAWKWLIPLALILAALFFFSQTASMTTSSLDSIGGAGTSTTTSGAGDVGVPLSADSFLSGF